MVGGWSPTAGASVVGRVENMPGGGVGEAAGSATEPQASAPDRSSAVASSPRIDLRALFAGFEFNISKSPS